MAAVTAGSPFSRRDRSRRSHFAPAASAGNYQLEFQAFQQWVIEEGFETLHSSPLALAALIASVPLLREQDVRSAYDACRDVRRWRGDPRIDWVADGRMDARFLSAPAVIAVDRAGPLWSFEEARDALLASLPAILAGSSLGACRTLDDLLLRATSFFQDALGPMFFAHACNVERLTALPRSALAREESGQCLKLTADATEADGTCEKVYGRAFEAALLGRTAGTHESTAFLTDLLSALRPPSKGSRAAKRAAILRNLLRLAPRLDQIDECCALLLGFAMMLVESGTAGRSVVAPTTPYDYIHDFALQFHAELAGSKLAEMDPADYAEIYRKLLPKDKPIPSYRVAGLKEFHRFLRALWTVPPLPFAVFEVEADSQVQANVVWPHEISRIRAWLQDAPCVRFFMQLAVAFAIASEVMIRAAELFVLRIANVDDRESVIVIEIAREISDRKEKTTEGRRRVFIRSPEAMQTIRAWVARRLHDEAAHREDYLFGDPADPRRIADRGRMYFWLNKLLKAATGDDTIALHIMRHSRGSEGMEAAAYQDEVSEINAADELATEAGHVGPHVTGPNYGHLFERAMRKQSDEALQRRPISYAAAARWAGIAESAVRKRASRGKARGIATEKILWELMDGAARKPVFPSIQDGILLGDPKNPIPSDFEDDCIGFEAVLHALSDCAAGLSTEQIASRVDLPQTQVVSIISFVGKFAAAHGDAADLPDPLALGIRALRDPIGTTLGIRPDFMRVRQDRWNKVSRAIPRIPSELLCDTVNYWSHAASADHLHVRPGRYWCRFASFLSETGINGSQIAIAKAPPLVENIMGPPTRLAMHRRQQAAEISALLDEAQIQLHANFGKRLREIDHAPRAGRPPLWLVIGSAGERLDTSGSANSIAGLNCLLLAAAAWLHVRSTTRKEDHGA